MKLLLIYLTYRMIYYTLIFKISFIKDFFYIQTSKNIYLSWDKIKYKFIPVTYFEI